MSSGGPHDEQDRKHIYEPPVTRQVVLDPEFDHVLLKATSQRFGDSSEIRFGHHDPEGLRRQMEKAQAECNRAAQVRASSILVPSLNEHMYEPVAIRQFASIKIYVHDSRSHELFFTSNNEIVDFLKEQIGRGALTAQTIDGNVFYHTGQIYALVDHIKRGQSP